MFPQTKILSYREIQFLDQLAQGATYKELQEYFGISPSNVHVHCHNIRHKTGIRHTRDAAECKRHLKQIPAQLVADALSGQPRQKRPFSSRPPTSRHQEVLRLLARGLTYHQIAREWEVTPQTVENTAYMACKRAGIVHEGWNRTKRIREWWRAQSGAEDPNSAPAVPGMSDPMF